MHPIVSSKLKTKLLPHQEEAVVFHIKKKFTGNFSEMGTGKTLVSLAVSAHLGKRTLVVCPPYLVENWLHELKKHTTLKHSAHFKTVCQTDEVTVIPYTQLDKCEELFKVSQVIICDEAHYLKNLDAKRTQRFHYLFYKYTPEYFLYLTGTPIKNRIPEIYSMLVLFSKGPNNPKILDYYKSYYVFCCRFTNVKQTQFGTKFEGMKNVEELRQFVNPFIIRHPSSLLNLPELHESNVIVSYSNNPDLEMAFSRFQDKGIGAEITVKRDSAVAKAKFTSNYVSNAIDSNQGPVVVFSDHKKPIEIMGLELSKLRTAMIDGDTNVQKRQEYVDRLNNGQLDVLLCTVGAASSGFNMTGASLMVFNDIPWTPGDLDQAKKRIHRMGQDKPCRIVFVVGSQVDERIIKAVNGKNKVINKVIKE